MQITAFISKADLYSGEQIQSGFHSNHTLGFVMKMNGGLYSKLYRSMNDMFHF
jgi:hypothetical protein